MVHRDLNPANLFLTSDGRVKILDFGLARTVQPVAGENDATETVEGTLTEDGAIMGTVGYMAPEQVLRQEADERSDVFSLGCVLYEMVAGQRSSERDSGPETMVAILKEEPRDLSESGVTLPAELEQAIERCLEKKPEARFQSAADLAYGLRSIGSGAAVPASRPVEVPQRVTSKKTWLAVAAAVILMVVGFTVWRLDRMPAEPEAPKVELVPNRIAVVPFVNRTGDPSLDTLGAMAADRIAQGLAELNELEVAPASAVAAAVGVGRQMVVREVAEGSGAGLVLTGAWDSMGDALELRATLEDAQNRTVVRAFDPIRAGRNAPQDAVATLRDRTLMAVQDHLHPVLAFASGDGFPTIDAYQQYRLSLESLDFEHFGKLFELDPTWARPRAAMASVAVRGAHAYPVEWGINQLVWAQKLEEWFLLPLQQKTLTFNPLQQRILAAVRFHLEGRWGALGELRQVLSDGHDNPPSRIGVMFHALRMNRLHDVVETFEGLESATLEPNVFKAVANEYATSAYHLLGRHQDELQTARLLSVGETATGIWGKSVRRCELVALAALGSLTEIEHILGELAVERSDTFAGPTWIYSEGLLVVAQELSVHGFERQARVFFERLVEWSSETDRVQEPEEEDQLAWYRSIALDALGRPAEGFAELRSLYGDDPRNAIAWARLGIAAARAGDRRTADEMSARLTDHHVRHVYGVWAYSRARIAARLGLRDEAIELLREAIFEGVSDYMQLHRDADLRSLWDDPAFQELLRPKG